MTAIVFGDSLPESGPRDAANTSRARCDPRDRGAAGIARFDIVLEHVRRAARVAQLVTGSISRMGSKVARAGDRRQRLDRSKHRQLPTNAARPETTVITRGFSTRNNRDIGPIRPPMLNELSCGRFQYRHFMRRLWVLGGLVLGLTAACHLPTKRNPDACCTTQADCDAIGLPVGSDCSDDRACIQNQCVVPTTCQGDSDCMAPTPFCAADGSCVECLDSTTCAAPLPVCGPTNTCVECVDSSTCGDQVCDTGTNTCRGCTDDSECPNGFCSPDSHLCRLSIVPKYLPTVCNTPATEPLLTFVADTSLDTSTDTVCNGGVVAQSLAPAICVLRYGSIKVPNGVTLRVKGTRVLALVADDGLSLDGILDISSHNSDSGPGGTFTVVGGAPDNHVGAGGAGFRTAGAPGGTASVDGGAANGGPASNPVSNPALVAGPSSNGFGAGGIGGGGATLISCRGSISVAGTIDAGAAGGGAGSQDVVNNKFYGGSGGGAGGYVVLQAPTIHVTGRVYANGGGGGKGLGSAVNGADGDRSVNPAPGGGTYPNETAGGQGAAATGPVRPGIKATSPTGSPGGGGGSMGFFQTYTPTGFTPSVNPTEASPGFEPNLIIETR